MSSGTGDTLVSNDSNFTLDASNRKISLGSSNNIFIADADDGIQLGNATFASAPFNVNLSGAMTASNANITGKISATSGDIGGFSIDTATISSSNNNLDLRKTEFWALKNISFELKQGETLGIIGHNGAGKTTLLKLISGLLYPTTGNIPVSYTHLTLPTKRIV